MDRPKILTWHIHGSYLYYLSFADCDFYIPVKKNKEEGYIGKTHNYSWGSNVHEIDAKSVKDIDIDCIVFQSRKNYLSNQYEILSDKQQRLPKVYIEHDPPREHPTDTMHLVNDPNLLLVHVTQFNNLMWDCRQTPTLVVEHGVQVSGNIEYGGSLAKGLVVINNLQSRGRRLGLDVFEKVKKYVPLDLIGMNSEEIGGLGEVPHSELPAFMSKYRFLFNPIRYTSLGLTVCEAMMIGMPIIGLATTELVTVIENNINGYVHTDVERLIEKMLQLIENKKEAQILGAGAKETAESRFSIERFARDWENIFHYVIYKHKLKNQKNNIKGVYSEA